MKKGRRLSAPEILQALSEVKADVRKRYKADIRGIFGSYVRGVQKEGSDVDVLVNFDEGANLLDLTGLSLFLEDRLGCPVDVVPESAIREEIKDGILREAAYL